jgi:hypothetical protein
MGCPIMLTGCICPAATVELVHAGYQNPGRGFLAVVNSVLLSVIMVWEKEK